MTVCSFHTSVTDKQMADISWSEFAGSGLAKFTDDNIQVIKNNKCFV